MTHEPSRGPGGSGRVAVPRGNLARTRPFRRMKADRVVGIIGVLLLLGSTFLFFSWEKPTPPPFGFNVSWPQNATDLAPVDITLREGSGAGPLATQDETWKNHTFGVRGPNLTRLEVTVFFLDDIGSGPGHWDFLNATLFGPPGAPLTSTSEGFSTKTQANNITLNVVLNRPPRLVEAPVGTPAEAEAYAANQTSDFGEGTWRLQLHLDAKGYEYSGPGSEPPQFSCNEVTEAAGQCRVDRSNDVEVSVRWSAYHAEFQAKK